MRFAVVILAASALARVERAQIADGGEVSLFDARTVRQQQEGPQWLKALSTWVTGPVSPKRTQVVPDSPQGRLHPVPLEEGSSFHHADGENAKKDHITLLNLKLAQNKITQEEYDQMRAVHCMMNPEDCPDNEDILVTLATKLASGQITREEHDQMKAVHCASHPGDCAPAPQVMDRGLRSSDGSTDLIQGRPGSSSAAVAASDTKVDRGQVQAHWLDASESSSSSDDEIVGAFNSATSSTGQRSLARPQSPQMSTRVEGNTRVKSASERPLTPQDTRNQAKQRRISPSMRAIDRQTEHRLVRLYTPDFDQANMVLSTEVEPWAAELVDLATDDSTKCDGILPVTKPDEIAAALVWMGDMMVMPALSAFDAIAAATTTVLSDSELADWLKIREAIFEVHAAVARIPVRRDPEYTLCRLVQDVAPHTAVGPRLSVLHAKLIQHRVVAGAKEVPLYEVLQAFAAGMRLVAALHDPSAADSGQAEMLWARNARQRLVELELQSARLEVELKTLRRQRKGLAAAPPEPEKSEGALGSFGSLGNLFGLLGDSKPPPKMQAPYHAVEAEITRAEKELESAKREAEILVKGLEVASSALDEYVGQGCPEMPEAFAQSLGKLLVNAGPLFEDDLEAVATEVVETLSKLAYDHSVRAPPLDQMKPSIARVASLAEHLVLRDAGFLVILRRATDLGHSLDWFPPFAAALVEKCGPESSAARHLCQEDLQPVQELSKLLELLRGMATKCSFEMMIESYVVESCADPRGASGSKGNLGRLAAALRPFQAADDGFARQFHSFQADLAKYLPDGDLDKNRDRRKYGKWTPKTTEEVQKAYHLLKQVIAELPHPSKPFVKLQQQMVAFHKLPMSFALAHHLIGMECREAAEDPTACPQLSKYKRVEELTSSVQQISEDLMMCQSGDWFQTLGGLFGGGSKHTPTSPRVARVTPGGLGWEAPRSRRAHTPTEGTNLDEARHGDAWDIAF